eukprot:scaffold25839_cov66-Phaeocystis_antarctica.AAC.3
MPRGAARGPALSVAACSLSASSRVSTVSTQTRAGHSRTSVSTWSSASLPTKRHLVRVRVRVVVVIMVVVVVTMVLVVEEEEVVLVVLVL